MNELTVIISFLNEGEEIVQTMAGIRATAGDAVDIICVNDASTDGFDYKKAAEEYKAVYIENKERLGCAGAREVGVAHCVTPYFLIVDGHMRFYPDNWWIEFIKAIREEPRAIYCCRCQPWDFLTKKESKNNAPYAAYIKIFDIEARSILNATWAGKVFPGGEIVDVPCVLGACYAASKTYWNYLKGLQGLLSYGCDEAYISLKVWMEGGRCRLLTHVRIGHLFREDFPYPIEDVNMVYNKLLMACTIFDDPLKSKLMRAMKASNYVLYIKALELQKEHWEEIENLKVYYQTILKEGYRNFVVINDKVIADMKNE